MHQVHRVIVHGRALAHDRLVTTLNNVHRSSAPISERESFDQHDGIYRTMLLYRRTVTRQSIKSDGGAVKILEYRPTSFIVTFTSYKRKLRTCPVLFVENTARLSRRVIIRPWKPCVTSLSSYFDAILAVKSDRTQIHLVVLTFSEQHYSALLHSSLGAGLSDLSHIQTD